MNYNRINPIYLKQVYTFQSNQITFANPKSWLPLKRFIVLFITTLNPRKPKSQIKAHLSYLANSYFYNYKPSPCILNQHRVLQKFKNNKEIVITKPIKGNGVVNLDGKLYFNAIEEIIWDTSKFEKLSKDPTLKCQTSLQRLLRKLKQKNLFNEIEYHKFYHSGSALARI